MQIFWLPCRKEGAELAYDHPNVHLTADHDPAVVPILGHHPAMKLGEVTSIERENASALGSREQELILVRRAGTASLRRGQNVVAPAAKARAW